MKKAIIIYFSLISLFSKAQADPSTKTSAPLTCSIMLLGTSNPTAPGLCNGTATISLTDCTNPPYQIQWFNSNPNSSCQMLPPAESAFTGPLYVVNSLCGCPSPYSILVTNSMGEQAFIQLSIMNPAPTGLFESTDEMAVSLSPNPATDILNIDLKTIHALDSGIDICNIFGQAVLTTSIHSGHQIIDLSTIPNGIYFVRFHLAGKHIGFRKIVVQK